MIKKFNTSVAPSAGASAAPSGAAAPSAGGKGMNKILIALLIVGVAYAGYQFVYKPMMAKRNAQNDQD